MGCCITRIKEPPLNLDADNMTENLNTDKILKFNNISPSNESTSRNSSSKKIKNFGEYFSINSKAIHQNLINNKNIIEENFDSHLKKNYTLLYFEIKHFVFWSQEIFYNLYPEVNLILIIEVNDDKTNQDKIFFKLSQDDPNKYSPLLHRIDKSYKAYRIFKPVEIINPHSPIKITFSFFSYSNHKLLPICDEEIIIQTNNKDIIKYKMYQNIYLKYNHKKAGNLIYNFGYHNIHYINMNEIINNRNIFMNNFNVIY